MKSKHVLSAALAAVTLVAVAGCNESARATAPIDPALITPEVRAEAGLRPDVEVLGAEELTYGRGTKMVRIRYRTKEGLVDTVELNRDKIITPSRVFDPR